VQAIHDARKRKRSEQQTEPEDDLAKMMENAEMEMKDEDEGERPVVVEEKKPIQKKKKKNSEKEMKESVRGWLTNNKSEFKKMRKMEKASAAPISIDAVVNYRKEFMKTNKKKDDEVHYTHILPLFVFLQKTSIIIEQIGEFDGVLKGKTVSGQDRIEFIEKHFVGVESDDEDDGDEEREKQIELSEVDLKLLKKKYGRTWWKLPSPIKNRRGYDVDFSRSERNPEKFAGKRKVKVTLLNVKGKMATTKDDERIGFITPVLQYEYLQKQ
jgi:hypothetical protein